MGMAKRVLEHTGRGKAALLRMSKHRQGPPLWGDTLFNMAPKTTQETIDRILADVRMYLKEGQKP